jgi:hypothetical protein
VGLSIHYELSLPGSTPREAVERIVEQLRRFAATLPIERVTDEIISCDGDCPWGAIFLPSKGGRRGKTRRLEALEPECAVFFSVFPGAGSESAYVGFARHRPNPVTRGRWFGQWACKTQYASSPAHGGVDHFVRCHLALVAILDEAKRLKLGVKVNDEGGYWRGRRLPRLLAMLEKYDQIIARVAGRLKDALAKEGVSMAAPITERPDFERLEAGGKQAPKPAWSEETKALIARTRGKL